MMTLSRSPLIYSCPFFNVYLPFHPVFKSFWTIQSETLTAFLRLLPLDFVSYDTPTFNLLQSGPVLVIRDL
jgi:hypothetical protein